MIRILHLFILVPIIFAAQPYRLNKSLQQLLINAAKSTKQSLPTMTGRGSELLSKRSATIPVINNKVDEIARAYAEGYKAALLAIQARSNIQRPQQVQTPMQVKAGIRSYIPHPRREFTVNAIEKSGIPRPPKIIQRSDIARVMNNIHNLVERSAPNAVPSQNQQILSPQQFLQQQFAKRSNISPSIKENTLGHLPQKEKRNDIERLNYAARHRNVFLDSIGGDPYRGASGILSRQHVWLKHRRESGEEPRKKEEFNVAPMEPIAKMFPKVDPQERGHFIVSRKSAIPHPPTVQSEPESNVLYGYQWSNPLITKSYIPYNYKALKDEGRKLEDKYWFLQKTEDDERIKRQKISRLNDAARHRNVFLDSLGGDPYGGAGGILTRQHFWVQKRKRSAEDDEDIDDSLVYRHHKKRKSMKGIL